MSKQWAEICNKLNKMSSPLQQLYYDYITKSPIKFNLLPLTSLSSPFATDLLHKRLLIKSLSAFYQEIKFRLNLLGIAFAEPSNSQI